MASDREADTSLDGGEASERKPGGSNSPKKRPAPKRSTTFSRRGFELSNYLRPDTYGKRRANLLTCQSGCESPPSTIGRARDGHAHAGRSPRVPAPQ